MATKISKIKSTTAVRSVPACLAAGRSFDVGAKVEYNKRVWRNGEEYLILVDGTRVPSIFFN
jgi:hypothetical protein